MDDLIQFDKELFLTINQDWSHRVMDAFMILVSNEKFWLMAAVAGIILIYILNKSSRFLTFVGVALLSVGITDLFTFRVLKFSFKRLRPCHDFPDAVRLLESSCGSQYGFPSNHAANAMAFFVISILFFPSWRWAWLLVPTLLVGYSRVYVGVHFPLDVLIGFLDGALISLAIFGVMRFASKTRREVVEETLDLTSKTKENRSSF